LFTDVPKVLDYMAALLAHGVKFKYITLDSIKMILEPLQPANSSGIMLNVLKTLKQEVVSVFYFTPLPLLLSKCMAV
jgi:hypothetical protein